MYYCMIYTYKSYQVALHFIIDLCLYNIYIVKSNSIMYMLSIVVLCNCTVHTCLIKCISYMSAYNIHCIIESKLFNIVGIYHILAK